MSSPSRPNPRSHSTLHAYLELVRLPNLFTAMADVAMGLLFVRAIAGPGDWCTLGLLAAASSLLYASGTVLGDVFDLEVDARQRPERPLPSGRVAPAVARWLGWELMLLGVAVAWLAGWLEADYRPGVVAVLLAGCIVLYVGVLKRTPVGPLAMGGCRMFNVLLGMSVLRDFSGAPAPLRPEHWLVAAGIGTYIVGVTWFARTEARQSSRLALGLALGVMLSGIALLGWFPNWTSHVGPQMLERWYLAMAVLGALIGWRCVWAVIEPVPHRVQMAVKQCILSLVVLDAAVAYAVRGPGAALILLLLIPAMFFGQWFRST